MAAKDSQEGEEENPRPTSFRLPRKLLEQFDKVAKKRRHTRQDLLIILMEEFLEGLGLWPPAEGE